MNFYAFHIGDYASATRHLTDFEDLAYRRLIDVYYVTEKPLPLDRRQTYRLARAASDDMRAAIDVVLQEFFHEEEDGWHHKRCDEEIATAKEKSSLARANGRLGGLAKANSSQATKNVVNAKQPLGDEVANATEKASEGLAPNPNPNPNKEIEARAFEEFWEACPKKVSRGAAEKAWGAAILKTTPDKLTDAMRAFARSTSGTEEKFIPKPSKWLEEERWLDADVQPKATAPPATPKVFVQEHSEAWRAWKLARPLTQARDVRLDGGIARGWYFPTEFPPSGVAHA